MGQIEGREGGREERMEGGRVRGRNGGKRDRSYKE